MVPVAVIALIIKKVPAIPALLAGVVLAGIVAVIAQPDIINGWIGQNTAEGNVYEAVSSYGHAAYMTVMDAMTTSVNVETSSAEINDLLSTGGMYGMLNTIWLIICAMSFGGIIEACGLLQKITETVLKAVRSTGSLIVTTASTCLFFNATASDQYLAIVVPGRMFADTYKDRELAPENLSRTLEDSGTVTSVLIPWNTCGATQASVLQVATGEYWMYCFFNLIS